MIETNSETRIVDIRNSYFPLKITAFWLLLFCGLSTFAQQLGTTEAIFVTSDSNKVSGLSSEGDRVITYIGNVRLIQGIVEITGDEAIVTLSPSSNEIVNALVTGNPVHFQRYPELDESETTGSSERIEYKVREAQVIFEGAVRFNQPGIAYECGRLLYSVESDLAEGTGGCRVTLAN